MPAVHRIIRIMHFLQVTKRTGKPSRHHLALHFRASHTEKANLEEKCLLLAQVRREAAQLLRDTLSVFRVWCFLAMSFVSLPYDPIAGGVDLTTQ